jgi:hypothetical protein
MIWFWPALGALAVILLVLAWLSDRAAKKRGLTATPDQIARNLKAFKRERRHRLMILRRTWVPTDDRPDSDSPPWRNR